MLLSARILENVNSVNDFQIIDALRFTEGDGIYVYFMLIDSTKDKLSQGFNPSGRRYIPASGATLQVTIPNIDDDKVLTKTATQPYATDGSIWRIQILSTDTLRGTYSLKLALTEGTTVTHGIIKNAIAVEPQDGAYC